ncbi:MAG: hypothetical protein ACI9CF_000869 [Candidatus Omnitrophota bacterium]|jgi:hypothetical protein
MIAEGTLTTLYLAFGVVVAGFVVVKVIKKSNLEAVNSIKGVYRAGSDAFHAGYKSI